MTPLDAAKLTPMVEARDYNSTNRRHTSSKKELLLQESSELDVDLRSELKGYRQSFRVYDEREECLKKLHEARDNRGLKLPSLEARQSQGY